MSDVDIAKISAAAAALDYIESGMTVGLGTGSTAAHFVRLLSQRALDGLKVRCVPTSETTRELADVLGLDMPPIDQIGHIDVTVDGADEIDPEFRLIKGGGAALLREKIVAAASTHMIVIADAAKMVNTLGKFPLPVEVTPFAVGLTAAKVYEALRSTECKGREAVMRMDKATGKPVVTDGGNHILDCRCERIPHADSLADMLSRIPGVVEHGLFINMARTVIIGREKGAEIREK